MVNMTLAIPEELNEKMKTFPDVKWTAVARKAIEQRIEDLEFLNKIAAKSKLSKTDAEEIGKRIKRSAAKRFAS